MIGSFEWMPLLRLDKFGVRFMTVKMKTTDHLVVLSAVSSVRRFLRIVTENGGKREFLSDKYRNTFLKYGTHSHTNKPSFPAVWSGLTLFHEPVFVELFEDTLQMPASLAVS